MNKRIAAIRAAFKVYTSSIVECHQRECDIMRINAPIAETNLLDVSSIPTRNIIYTVKVPNRADKSTR
ncbi:unnamed protein product [marine sediment metagenome]|uniref:Uncharacterized protein n=1 Tax=marine sediment metagenome TaxID=412755 RepID=X1JCT4_9ZZZZ